MSGRSSPQLRSRSNNGSDRSGLPFGNAASGQSARLWVIDAEMASYFCLFAAYFSNFFYLLLFTEVKIPLLEYAPVLSIPNALYLSLSRTRSPYVFFCYFLKKYDHHFLCPHLLFLCSRLKNTSEQSWLLH